MYMNAMNRKQVVGLLERGGGRVVTWRHKWLDFVTPQDDNSSHASRYLLA